MIQSDTIAAVSTGMASAGISIIRLSGDQAFEVADAVFRGKSGPGSAMASNTMH